MSKLMNTCSQINRKIKGGKKEKGLVEISAH
jgi:hypothetical protein